LIHVFLSQEYIHPVPLHEKYKLLFWGGEGKSYLMQYSIIILKRALKDLESIQKSEAQRILSALDGLQHDLTGDVKKLTNHTPEYRLRVGSYRILFEIQDDMIYIYRILHRSNAYK
jgi:mRNA interferase RelE/StbE